LNVVAAAGLLSLGVVTANAAGALAVGACAAYGYAYDYPSSETAQTVAIEKCGDSCKEVVTTQKGCVAFANASRLGAAQNTALKYCYKFGGKDCVIRAWICDGKKG
jgi:hypothetical protein